MKRERIRVLDLITLRRGERGGSPEEKRVKIKREKAAVKHTQRFGRMRSWEVMGGRGQLQRGGPEEKYGLGKATSGESFIAGKKTRRKARAESIIWGKRTKSNIEEGGSTNPRGPTESDPQCKRGDETSH